MISRIVVYNSSTYKVGATGMESKLIVAKDNQLIQAGYTLSIAEQRIILICIAKLDSRKKLPDNYEFTISVDELHRETGVSRENAYRDLKIAVDKLYKQTIYLDPSDPFSEMRWLLKKAAFKNECTVQLFFSPLILPFLTELKKCFTRYKLRDVAKFKCSYSLRFYEILVQWKDKKKLKVSVKWLRDILLIGDKYPRIIDFKKYVVIPSLNDINEFSNMRVTFDQIKSGKEITDFVFKYSLSGENETKNHIKINDDAIKKHARPGESLEQVRERLLKLNEELK